jgi:hypothetical protein
MTVFKSTGRGPGPVAVAGGPRVPKTDGGLVRHRRSAVGVVSAVVVALAVILIAGLIVPSLGGAAVTGRSSDRSGVSSDLNCNGVVWRTTHLAVFMSGCQAVFGVQYAENFNQTETSANQYNFSFSIPWLAEITPSGSLVRLASALAPVSAQANLTRLPGEVVLSSYELLNVTNASGAWIPNDAGFGTGTPWNVSNRTVGTVEVGVDFYLYDSNAHSGANQTANTSLSVEFDLSLGWWPWANSSDLLGFDLDSLGAGGSHFVFNQSSQTLQEQWNSTNHTFASLVFGTVANASYTNGTPFPTTVTEQAGLYYAASPARESVVLATFGGVTGGYPYLTYDPWVVFSPGTTVPPSSFNPGSSGWPPWATVSLAVVAAVGGLSGLAVIVLRGQRLRSDGAALVREMRKAISEPTEPPTRPR